MTDRQTDNEHDDHQVSLHFSGNTKMSLKFVTHLLSAPLMEELMSLRSPDMDSVIDMVLSEFGTAWGLT